MKLCKIKEEKMSKETRDYDVTFRMVFVPFSKTLKLFRNLCKHS